jgi:adenine/guanine phosphoribosyltransferase-like PRPP-binding protein
MSTSCAGHLRIAFSDRKRIIDKVCRRIKRHTTWSDAGIAMCGLSGLLVGIPVADKLDRDIAILRKSKQCHSGLKVEGQFADKYIIVDDLIDRGKTVRDILDEMPGKCVGIVLYNNQYCAYASNYFNNIKVVKI